uniref:Uncharacterized protein n=1 Tax=Anguilla anguilla TaxID=7936 RepID=A0A0E9UAK3_ANGAN
MSSKFCSAYHSDSPVKAN